MELQLDRDIEQPLSHFKPHIWYPMSKNHLLKDENMSDEKQSLPEWISTKDAMKILEVESTQAVRYLMEQYPNEFKKMNVGSEKQPRWVLWRKDVVEFQNKRQPPNERL